MLMLHDTTVGLLNCTCLISVGKYPYSNERGEEHNPVQCLEKKKTHFIKLLLLQYENLHTMTVIFIWRNLQVVSCVFSSLCICAINLCEEGFDSKAYIKSILF